MREPVFAVARKLHEAEKKGVALCKHATEPTSSESIIPCPRCGKVFASNAAMAAHPSRTHGTVSAFTRVAPGTVCQVCSVDHQTTKQLKKHLYNKKTCLKAYLAADLSHDVVRVDGATHAGVRLMV